VKRIYWHLAGTVVLLTIAGLSSAAVKKELFTLVRGQKVEVCEAYLARLNASHFEFAPLCDRPEDTAVPGFSALTRESLSPDAAFAIWPSIAEMEKPGVNTSDWTVEAATRELGHSILAWRYTPDVDIQNNGSPRGLVIWRGSRVQTGVMRSDFACGDTDSQTPQLAFILDATQSSVDADATKRVFWRPKPAILSATVDGKLHRESIELPIGQHMSIFKFKGLYYFDTFFSNDGWGDYRNGRTKDGSLENTLAVFLSRNGKTREMCELRENKNNARRTQEN
jgi:hypothetical protein